ncbi:hypothetical protein RvY_04005 [Ramazzottius varieornatus]|uniref:Uncharacterized protein n=1 Tax=Ramazzottius varieornatus TaxID=947166 RepID=A0A1D1UTI1_RAMVA|nr:hypothetical protein RvY_04005 [Ramazzottius varieornatus]
MQLVTVAVCFSGSLRLGCLCHCPRREVFLSHWPWHMSCSGQVAAHALTSLRRDQLIGGRSHFYLCARLTHEGGTTEFRMTRLFTLLFLLQELWPEFQNSTQSAK